MTKIETKRQYLMELDEKNLPGLYAMLQDEQMMNAWYGVLSESEINEWYENQLSRIEYSKYGIWAAMLKKNMKYAGYSGLTLENINGLYVLGVAYIYNRDYQHKGYATDAVKSCVKYAFEALGYPEVFAVVRDDNIPAMNVAIRSGMFARQRIIRRCRGIDVPHIVFSIKQKVKK